MLDRSWTALEGGESLHLTAGAEARHVRPPGRPRPRLLVALLALIPAVHLFVLVPELWRGADETRDFTAYVLAAERVHEREPLYDVVPSGPHVPGEGLALYLYPPFLAGVLALVPFSGLALARFVLLAGVLCFWIYAASLDRVANGRATAYGTLLWGAVLTCSIAALGALWVGQVDTLIWALFGVALAYPALRGFGFAAAAMTKPFAVWPLGVALWRERRPVAISAGVAIVAAVGLSALTLGFAGLVRTSVEWLTVVYPNLAQGQFAYAVPGIAADPRLDHLLGFLGTGNLSLGFLPLQLAHAGGWDLQGAELPLWARLYLTTVGLAAPIAAIWLTRRRTPVLRYAAVMCAAVLFGPIFRATYAPILFTLAAAWIADRRARKHGPPMWTPAAG